MRDLSRASGDRKYEVCFSFELFQNKLTSTFIQDAAEKASATLHDQPKNDGLVPISINTVTGKFSGSVISFGARGDSYYEYLLKQWLQTGRKRSV